MSYAIGLRCLSCRKAVSLSPFRYFCPHCGGFLDVEYDYEAMRRSLKPSAFDSSKGSILEQWLEFLPIESPGLIARVTLGESPTPMVRATRLPPSADTAQVWLKNDSHFPTCSLKDRSMPLTVLKALELGRNAVGIVSSGNASGSLAAYAARAGLRAVVFMGSKVASGKLYKTMVYRPLAIQVQAPYSEAETLFQRARDEFGFFDCNGLVNPYRIEGKKTFAYEVARDLHWRAPDAVFMPAGYGNGVVAAWKGFKELQRLGFIENLPAIIAVQPAVCAPIVHAYDRGLATVEAIAPADSIAEAVCVNDPVIGGQRVLEAVRESGGRAIGVGEGEIAQAVRILAEREGLAVEPTGAVALAGLLRLLEEGSRWSGGIQVASITGHGLNDPDAGGVLVRHPILVEADYGAVQRALRVALGGR
jgi:threonine synthase